MHFFANPFYSYHSSPPLFTASPVSLDSRRDSINFTSIFFPSIDHLPTSFEDVKRIWKVLTLASIWWIELLTKIMCCFHWMQNKQLTHQPIVMDPAENSDDQESLRELFGQPIDYPGFRNRILNHKNWFYNNYGSNAFFQLKDADWSILENCRTEAEKELKASMVVYDTIVDLYVERFLNQYPELNNEQYLPCLRTIALTIAIKISWDESIENVSFQQFIFPYMGVKLHKKMELAFLKAISWNTSISELSIFYKEEAFEEEDFESIY